ncbi:MAG: hypothetical protein R2747_15480 [Pyrinomonadaceae bacterium]
MKTNKLFILSATKTASCFLRSFVRSQKRKKRFSLTAHCLLAVLILALGGRAATVKSTHILLLGETEVTINVYENEGKAITFFAPHHNEQTGLNLAREFIDKNGGRLVEIESISETGAPRRNLFFKVGERSFQVDPNRIYTANGRSCALPEELRPMAEHFSENLLKVIFAPDGKSLRSGERFLVAIHNNADISGRVTDKESDLSAFGYIRSIGSGPLKNGAFEDQADGVYLSNFEIDPDNFIFLSTPKYLGYFAELGFNVVVQKPAFKLGSSECRIDDGSLSVYSGQNSIPYICLEADTDSGRFRQSQMIAAVYDLLQTEEKAEK